MGLCAIDYSWTKPTPKAIKAAGYIGVLRYLSPTPSKNLSPTERDALHTAGLGILLAWEWTATRATQGRGAGYADAASANQLADALMYPDLPIFYAVDGDYPWAEVAPYFNAARGASQRPVKVYGSGSVVNGAFTTGFGTNQWQTVAWSGTYVSPHCGVYQRLTKTLPPIAGVSPTAYDENAVLPSLIWWTAKPPLTPLPQPQPIRGTTMTLIPIVISTDANGNGWDAQFKTHAIKWTTFVAATCQGSDPTLHVDATYWTGNPHVQERTGLVLVSVTGAAPNSRATVFVTHA